jgi:hypothetical protein
VNLHEQLDGAFEAINPAPAPIEEAMKRGTRIRRRRRATAVACAAAVVAAAICIPLTVHWQFSSSPATSHYTVTVQPPGPHSPANEVAYGTVNGKAWRILMSKATSTATGYGNCVQALGPAIDNELVLPMACEPPSGATPGDPVVFQDQAMNGGPDPLAFGYGGEVAKNVAYVTVTLTNGTVLTLRPVTVYGSRYVAFATPSGTVVRVTAYSRQGEIASAIAFTGAGDDQFFSSAWLRPGQRGIPLATGLLGSGTIDGKPWSATADLGPWGICTLIDNEDPACAAASAPVGMGAMVNGVRTTKSDPPALSIWTVPSSTIRAVVTVHGEKAFQVRPITVGGQKFIVFETTGTPLWQPSVSAYDSAGHVIGSLP